MQSLTVTGRMGKDAKAYQTTTGQEFYTFTLASNSQVRGEKKTTWYDVVAFNTSRLKNMVPHLKKGTSLIVVGELDAKAEMDTNGIPRLRLNLNADRIDFNSTGERSSNSDSPFNNATVSGTKAKAANTGNKSYQPEEIQVMSAPVTTGGGDVEEVEDDLPF